MPLILLDFHSDVYTVDLKESPSSANWLNLALSNKLIGRAYWIRPKNGTDYVMAIEKECFGEQIYKGIECIPHLKGPVLLSIDMDFFSCVIKVVEQKPAEDEIRNEISGLEKILKERIQQGMHIVAINLTLSGGLFIFPEHLKLISHLLNGLTQGLKKYQEGR